MGGGLRQIKHLPQSPFTSIFFQITTFGLAFYQSNLSTILFNDVVSLILLLGVHNDQQCSRPELEFLNNLWGPGTEQDRVIVPARQATQAGGIHSLESIPGLHLCLKIRAQVLCMLQVFAWAKDSRCTRLREKIYAAFVCRFTPPVPPFLAPIL